MKLATNTLLTLSLLVVAPVVEGGKKKKNKKKKGPKKPKCVILYENGEDGEPTNPPDMGKYPLGTNIYLVDAPLTLHPDDTLPPVAKANAVCDVAKFEPSQLFYCSFQIIFTDPHWSPGGTLTYTGLAPEIGVTTPGLMTITGGSGGYKKAKGYVNYYVPKDQMVDPWFKHEICFE